MGTVRRSKDVRNGRDGGTEYDSEPLTPRVGNAKSSDLQCSPRYILSCTWASVSIVWMREI